MSHPAPWLWLVYLHTTWPSPSPSPSAHASDCEARDRMSWLRRSEPHVVVSIDEVRLTQTDVKVHRLFIDATSNAQRYPSRATNPEPVDPVSHRYRCKWSDSVLRVPLFPWVGPPTVRIQFWSRKRRRKALLGSVEYALRDILEPGAEGSTRQLTLPATATFFQSLNLKIDLRFEIHANEDALETWKMLTDKDVPEILVPEDFIEPMQIGSTLDTLNISGLAGKMGRALSIRSGRSNGIGNGNGNGHDMTSSGTAISSANRNPSSVDLLGTHMAAKASSTSLFTMDGAQSVAQSVAQSQASGNGYPNSQNGHQSRRRHKKASRGPQKSHFSWDTASDATGVVYLEIVSVRNLPRFRTLTGLSFDMDPFVVISFGRRTFKTPYRRHTTNPTFDQKLLFLVEKHEKNYDVTFTIWDKDRVTLNDQVAEASISIPEIVAHGPVCDDQTGLYDLANYTPATLSLPCRLVDGSERRNRSKGPLNTEMLVNVHYLPYSAVRQQLWRGIASMYDMEDRNGLDYQQLTSMLNSVGSTLLPQTIQKMFAKFHPETPVTATEPVLSIDEVIMSIEEHLARPIADQEAVDAARELVRSKDPMSGNESRTSMGLSTLSTQSPMDSTLDLDLAQDASSISDREPVRPLDPERAAASYAQSTVSSDVATSFGAPPLRENPTERVILLRVCPICHKPQMGKYSEAESMRHVSLCASKQWSGTDTVLLDDRYVTKHQASRRWYTKFLSKFSFGSYQLGANSANIFVQDRISGQIEEERMGTSVRLGIRLLYTAGPVETRRVQKLLRKYTLKQGIKYDSPSSSSSIKPFIKFHNLDMSDVLEPVHTFSTFNEFFYRKLKTGARPIENSDEPRTAVSLADCRLSLFPTIDLAKEVWIKGKGFTLQRLFGDVYPDEVPRFDGGSLVIFRLAPQDYHRFHIPVDGVLGEPKHIPGHYYTVNPMAIRSPLDVYGQNARTAVPIISPQFGHVMVVLIGAMMVGGIEITAKTGQQVKRGDELGFFKFGGSTAVVLFEKDKIVFDADLVSNSAAAMETLVRVGMSIGHTADIPEHTRVYDTRQQTIKRAQTTITGGGSYMPFSLD